MNSFTALMLEDKADAAEVIHCTEQMCWNELITLIRLINKNPMNKMWAVLPVQKVLPQCWNFPLYGDVKK